MTGSLGSVSSRGSLYNQIQAKNMDVMTWKGRVTTHASEPLRRNLFLQSLSEEEQEIVGKANDLDNVNNNSPAEIQDKDIVECLESDVQYWTDFSKVHYHPQSLYELSGLWADIQEFDNYGLGKEAFCGHQHGEEIDDRLRFFVEECDHIQGIQCVVDDAGGFSGVSAMFLESIADEYPNVPVLLYNARNPSLHMDSEGRKQAISHYLHDAVSFSRLSELCKLIIPVGLPSLSGSRASQFLCIKDEKPYHSSAVYASAMHSFTLPFRMKQSGPSAESLFTSGALDMYGTVQMLAGQMRQNMVTILDVAMPAPSLSDRAQHSFLGNLQPLIPDISEDVEDFHAVETMNIHGAVTSGNQRASINEVKDAVESAYDNSVTRPKFSHLSASTCPLPIPLPFPLIFGNMVGQHGELLETPISGSSSRGSLEVHSIPMATRLRSSTAVLPLLERKLGNLRRFGIERGALGAPLLQSWGFGKDEVEDMGEVLSKMVTTLKPYQYSSDSD
uniref:DML1/Misato tubulin domain-containing protein n=1 Tax=Solanum tuberosum TaxID=4113 RepID=M1CAW9_SOLTU